MKGATGRTEGLKESQRTNRLLPVAVAVLLCSCGGVDRVGYSRFVDVPVDGWPPEQTFAFDPEETDSARMAQTYDLVVSVRYTTGYPYRELWLALEEFTQEGYLRTDTVQLQLTDGRGHPMGRGKLGLYSVTDTIRRDLKVPEGYHVEIGHVLADEELEGVRNIGLTLLRKGGPEEKGLKFLMPWI